ncbi:MAG: alpha/beta hydrolase [Balneolaceae bacterium]|nr:alpha/beta hydrolase [Balneolaceae bacterium]
MQPTWNTDNLPDDPKLLDRYITDMEGGIANLRPGTRAKIVWTDPLNKKITDTSLVYLHGFTASHDEGYPVHKAVAARYGMNLYLSRLARHGLEDPDAFRGLTAEQMIESARFAIAVGQKIGRKVILMGTSTGGSLSIYLSARQRPGDLEALVLYSPLVKLRGIRSLLLGNAVGRTLLRTILGRGFTVRTQSRHPEHSRIWYIRYRLDGPLALGKLIEQTMTGDTFRKINLPVFIGYYRKNWREQDRIVSVSAIQQMSRLLSTPAGDRCMVNFPEAGTHVICSGLLSNAVDRVKNETFSFFENVLGHKPLEKNTHF